MLACLVGWLIDCLAGWLVGWLVGRLVCSCLVCYPPPPHPPTHPPHPHTPTHPRSTQVGRRVRLCVHRHLWAQQPALQPWLVGRGGGRGIQPWLVGRRVCGGVRHRHCDMCQMSTCMHACSLTHTGSPRAHSHTQAHHVAMLCYACVWNYPPCTAIKTPPPLCVGGASFSLSVCGPPPQSR